MNCFDWESEQQGLCFTLGVTRTHLPLRRQEGRSLLLPLWSGRSRSEFLPGNKLPLGPSQLDTACAVTDCLCLSSVVST